MKKTSIFIFFLGMSLCYFSEALAIPLCDAFGEVGYASGYIGGEEDKSLGDKYDPEAYWALPILQAGINSSKEQLEQGGHVSKKDMATFKSCSKSGFIEGYHDGNYGKPKKNLIYI